MSKLFDGDLDADFNIRGDNEYAKNYDNWRKKEELNKLKTKYGDLDISDSSSSSSEDDEDGVELTEEVERDFYKTLSCLKNKDPRIYDENVRFFNDKSEVKKVKKKKEEPVYLKDYERKLILEKGGKLSDSEEEEPRARSPTYVEEQKKIKEKLKNALDQVDDEDEEDWGGLFKERKKTKDEIVKEEADYKEWLAGQKKQLEDKNTETELKPLKEYWNNPKLDEGEKFLRDYILNKKFLDKDDDNYIPTYDEVVHDSDTDDEEIIEKQEEFEHKYNFRFEEPDQEFIKRYPRTMENSLRRKDDKRSVKRQELKERKQREKEEKMADIKKLKELKLKEIEEKIEKLREVTGKEDVEFRDEDLDGDFDPEEHDRKMQTMFNDDFYQQAEDEQKPEFPDLDEELEIENWERFDAEAEVPHCEDQDFNMDCDYDPSAAAAASTSAQDDMIESSKGRKKRKRKSKFAEAVTKPKPKFDPNDKTYEKYLDEYYKLDCEDFIGDLPCRFKYRQVPANDFGLSVEEILLAKDRELNRWCSLKKAIQIRPDHVEKYDQIAFKKKGQNIQLKKKLLPSLFEEEKVAAEVEQQNAESNTVKKQQDKQVESSEKAQDKNEQTEQQNVAKKKKKKKQVPAKPQIEHEEITEPQKTENNTNKKKKQVELSEKQGSKNEETTEPQNGEIKTVKKKKKKKQVQSEVQQENNQKSRKRKQSENNTNTKKKFKKNDKTNVDIGISDARLQAYGIKPKKFKNKLKYGNKS